MKKSNPPVIRVACYVRVSTENQLENYSIEEQTERLKAYCRAKGWSIQKIYTDGGYSGGNTKRPALQQMLRAIHEKKIDLVVVYKLDRLSRSQKDTLTLIEDEFIAHDVDFVSVNENFDTSTPFGRAMIGILSVFAQLEKDQITERFMMGRTARSKAGYFHGGPTPPTGYKYIDGKLIVDDLKALQIVEIFDRFLRGYSVNAIHRFVIEKYGWKSSHVAILTILKNSAYIGKVKFGGKEYDGVHQPIISEETFYKVQELLKSPEREGKKSISQKNPFRAGYTLSGLIRCAQCGARFSAGHGYYTCYSRSKNSAKYILNPDCRNKKWRISDLDDLVINEIRALAIRPDRINRLWENIGSETLTPNAETAQSRIKELDAQLARLIDLYQIGSIPMDQVSSKANDLEREKKNLEEYLHPQARVIQNSKEDFVARIKAVDIGFYDKPIEERRMLIGSIIEFVEIDDSNVQIKWRI